MTLRPDGVCRSCEALVTWVITPKGGYMPLDPEPVEDGNIWVTSIAIASGQPLIAVALTHAGVPEGQPAYVSHSVTCPARS